MRLLPAAAIGILFSMLATAQPASAAALSEIAVLARCYGHLTGHPLPVTYTLRTQVESGALTAKAACEQILDKAFLVPSTGYLTNPSDNEAYDILRNFNNFHRSWFPSNTVEAIQEYGLETARGTTDIYDTTEPGLAVTRAMFSTDGKYSDVLTLDTGVHAIRQEDAGIKAMFGWTVTFPGRRLFGNNGALDLNLFHFSGFAGGFDGNSDNNATSLFANLPKIEVGELMGVRKTTEAVNIPNVNLYPLGSYVTGNTVPALNFSFNLFQTQGGGVLGTPIYLMLNYGQGRGTFSNGTTKLPRRWAQTNMNTFMCASLPALREADITSYYVGTSSAPFRNSTSCLRCHANLDPMAYTARNFITAGTDYTEFTTGSRTHAKAAMVGLTFAADTASVAGWPSEPVANFQRQTPTGRLYFRSFASGELINKTVNNIPELGAAMAATDDFYQCAAKRYFAFFTGLNISLYDRHDSANATLNKALTDNDIKDRAFVESLGAQLKSTQSVRAMIKTIMASDYYRTSNYRP